MAITKTTTVQRVEVYPDNRMMVVYNDVFDDPDDDQLPHESNRVVHLSQTTSVVDEEGNQTETPTDVSGHDPLVQTIAAAVWAD
jgi:hypothetical protein